MDDITLATFSLHRPRLPFDLRVPEIEDIRPLQFLPESSCEALSETLNAQVKINAFHTQFLHGLCQDGEDCYTVQSFEPFTVQSYPPGETMRAAYEERYPALLDVLSRDYEALDQRRLDVLPCATVLLVGGAYYGHIYCWISPTSRDHCIAVGIRGPVDLVLRRATKSEARVPVAPLLLEGVRRFAAVRGAAQLFILRPLSVMRAMLTRMGFSRVAHAPAALIGKAVGNTHGGASKDCLAWAVSMPLCEKAVTHVVRERGLDEQSAAHDEKKE